MELTHFLLILFFIYRYRHITFIIISWKIDLSLLNIIIGRLSIHGLAFLRFNSVTLLDFKELIFFLTNEFSHKSTNQLETLPFVMANKDWDEIDNYFHDAFSNKKIYLCGEGFCQVLVNYTYRKLLLKKIYAIDLEGVEISLVSDETPYTLITFSQSGENKRGLLKMDECKSYGGKVIAITATEKSSYTKKSDLSLIVESGSTARDQENQNLNYFFGNSLNLMEYLINRYTKPSK